MSALPKADMPVQQNGRRFSQDVNRNSTSTKKLRARSSSLIFVCFSQLWHEHQPADPQAVQLSLPFGQDRRAGTHMTWNYSAQLRIVGAHKTCDFSELGRIACESQNRQIGLVDRGVEWQISDQRGMSVVE